MYFWGIILSFLWNHDRITYNIKYKESVAFHEKKYQKNLYYYLFNLQILIEKISSRIETRNTI